MSRISLKKSQNWKISVFGGKWKELLLQDLLLRKPYTKTLFNPFESSFAGKFVLRHQSSGKCLAYKSEAARVVLRTACQFVLIETSDKYLQRNGGKQCIKRLNDTHDSELTLSSDCTSAAAAFRYNATAKLIVFTADDGQDLCVYFPQGGGAESTRSLVLADCGKEPKSYFQKEPRP